ncbi:MAG: ribonuclease H-like domain-containing protein [Candidatus Spechtbacterales bacterium]
MSYLVFDIETIGKSYEDFDDKSREIFREWASREAKTDEEMERSLEQIKQGLPFSPFLGEIVAIAVMNGQEEGGVYFQAPDSDILDFEDGEIKYRVGTEYEILERFWDIARHYSVFATFNGRGFDVPYLMIRSAVNKVKPTQNLMSNRYLSLQKGVQHVDLQDQLGFYGAVQRRPKLHFVAQAFGIESPKKGEIEGAQVPKAFRDKRYKEIAEYCMDDVIATRKLYEYWNEYLNL